MKRKSNLSIVTRRDFLLHPCKVFVAGIVLAFILTSCAIPNQTQAPTQTILEPTATLAVISTRFSSTPTQALTKTKTPAYEDYIPSISEAQLPIVISTNGPTDPEYLYKNVIVTFKTPWMFGDNYLNLDDLYDNTPENSDIIINHGTGSETSYDIYAANGATYHYSGLYGMNHDTCLEHFPFTKMDPDYYYNQSYEILSGRDYCILTSEGHLAILHFEPTSRYLYSADSKYLMPEVVVTSYKQIISQALIPYPTDTPGPTPVPGRYAGMNLTHSQQRGLDKAAQTFLDTVNSGNRESVADLMLYPLSISVSTEYYYLTAKDQKDFLSVYGEVFTPEVIQEFKNASVIQNMGVHFGGSILLVVPHCAVFYYPDGNISGISQFDQEPTN